jgi:hypothetical protein
MTTVDDDELSRKPPRLRCVKCGNRKPRISSTAQAARREAESRDARARLRENQQ